MVNTCGLIATLAGRRGRRAWVTAHASKEEEEMMGCAHVVHYDFCPKRRFVNFHFHHLSRSSNHIEGRSFSTITPRKH